jgi:hypothetical protein
VQYILRLCPLSADAAGQLDVLGHDGHPLGVDSAKIGILKETNQICLRGFLKGSNSRGLEAEVSLEVLSNFTDQTLEGQLADEEVSTLLVTADLTESYSSWPEPVGLLDTSRGGCALASSLGG